jgi:hypothetical protein
MTWWAQLMSPFQWRRIKQASGVTIDNNNDNINSDQPALD